MLTFASSMVCVLALLTTDIRFRATGYNQTFRYVPEIVGSFGVLFSFIGLLGTYDDRWNQLWWFNRFLLVKLATMLLSVLADFVTLQSCESWKNGPDSISNPHLLAISEQSLCSWARWSYAIGCSIDLGVTVYVFLACRRYEHQLRFKSPYSIDFGMERYDTKSRWDFYQVRDPHKDKPLASAADQEEDPFAFYGATEKDDEEAGHYGPDGMRARQPVQFGVYSPDAPPQAATDAAYP